MFQRITEKSNYMRSADVQKLPITYDGKIQRTLFGHQVLLENDPWLWHLHLKLTDACNASCKFCVEQNSHCQESPEKFLESVDLMLTEMEHQNILYSVSVTGGEPLLFRAFERLCDILSSHDIQFLTMNTNGKFLKQHLDLIDGRFDWVNVSRHALGDRRNDEIFGDTMPTIEELRQIKAALRHTKMRIQCVMCDMEGPDDMLEFISAFRFSDDLSFRKLMKLSERHGVFYDDKECLYQEALQYAYDHFHFVEQSIQDYYIYEIWDANGIPVTFSHSNMAMLYGVEAQEPDNVCREFVIHPDGVVCGSWDENSKVLYRPR